MAHDDSSYLAHLAGLLCETIAANGGNVLIHVQKPTDDGYDVGTLSLGGRRPADALLGFVAPDEWITFGCAGRGRPSHLDTGSRHGLPVSVAVVVLVHRGGEVIGRLRMGDTVIDDAPAYGLTLDCLQRAFGLPTAPPLVTTGARFASAWLEHVVRAAGQGPAVGLSWPEVAALHPAAAILHDHVPTGDDPAGDDLVAQAKALERTCDWERLRWLVVEGRWHEKGVTPTDAAWLDAGSFSRFALSTSAPVHVLLGEVRRAAGPAIARRCRAVLRQLDLRGGRAAA